MKMTKQSNDFTGFRFLIKGQDAKVGDTVEMEASCAAACSKRGWVQAAHYVDPNAKPQPNLTVKAIKAYDADKPKTRRSRAFEPKEN